MTPGRRVPHASLVDRDRIHYSVGNEHNPGDPFGRSRLVIEVDGAARLEQFTRSGRSTFTGKIDLGVLDELWAALDEAQFPSFPKHHPPAGAAIRDLNVGGPGGKSAFLAYHLAATLPGYNTAFAILDQVVRQLSEDTVKAVPRADRTIVDAVTRLPADR